MVRAKSALAGLFGNTAVRRGLIAAVIPVIAFGGQAIAQSEGEYVQDIGASERVNYAGKLRMLSQRVVASTCNFAAGVDPEASGKDMQASREEFGVILDALEFGNEDLGIVGKEARKKTIIRIGMLRDEWAPVEGKISAIDINTNASQSVETVAERASPLLEAAKLLVGDISAQYSDPFAMKQSDALLVDYSGRQRMLTQRMSKNVCLISSGVMTEAAKTELQKTAETFEVTLLALREGMNNAGIAPPPNAEIAYGLSVVAQDWSTLKPSVAKVLAGDALSTETRAAVYNGMNKMTANMNSVVMMYSEASKQESM